MYLSLLHFFTSNVLQSQFQTKSLKNYESSEEEYYTYSVNVRMDARQTGFFLGLHFRVSFIIFSYFCRTHTLQT
jgi:hypothetical protein